MTDMTRSEANEFYGEAGTYDYLDEIEDEERGLTLREVMAERQVTEIRSAIYADLKVGEIR